MSNTDPPEWWKAWMSVTMYGLMGGVITLIVISILAICFGAAIGVITWVDGWFQ